MSLWAYDPVTFVLIGEAFPVKIADGFYREPDNSTSVPPLVDIPGQARVYEPDKKRWRYDTVPVKQERIAQIKTELVRLDEQSVRTLREFVISLSSGNQAQELKAIEAQAEVLRAELIELQR